MLLPKDFGAMGRPLTERQQQVYDFVRERIIARGFGPTVREIGEYLDIRSPNGVICHLKALERKGMLRRLANKSRAIELSELIPREPQTQVPLGGKLVGDICSLASMGAAKFDFQDLLGPERFALEIVGDELRELQIVAGDALIIQRQCSATAGQLALVQLSGESLRLFYWMPEATRVRLQPLGRASQPLFAQLDTEVLGIVVGLIRRFH